MKKIKIFFIFLIFCSFNLKINSQEIDKEVKTIHIFVALCDNKNQGIVKVPEKIGNGQDSENNLYWGCAYGIKTYFKRSKEWKLLSASSGITKSKIKINDKTIGTDGNAELISYIGHNGLMDFNIRNKYINKDKKKRDVIILACYSKLYFPKHLKSANVNPLLWTTGRMAPEAYTIHDAINGYLNNEDNEKIRERGALAYSKYQKCSKKAANNLLVTGW